MGKVFNKKNLTERRKQLRNNLPRAEVILWTYLKGKQVSGYKFRRQFSIQSYVTDFYCPVLRFAIEIDGATHQSDEEIQSDKSRQQAIESLGITFLRFTNLEIYKNLNDVLIRIKAKILEIEKSRNNETSLSTHNEKEIVQPPNTFDNEGSIPSLRRRG